MSVLLSSGCAVDVFGLFGNGKCLYHYWDKARGVEGNHYKEQQLGKRGHRFLTEHKVFTELWSKMFKLRFVV